MSFESLLGPCVSCKELISFVKAALFVAVISQQKEMEFKNIFKAIDYLFSTLLLTHFLLRKPFVLRENYFEKRYYLDGNKAQICSTNKHIFFDVLAKNDTTNPN